MKSKKFLNSLNLISGVGSQKMRILLDYFKTAENVWQSELGDLKKSGLSEKLAEKIFWERQNINPDEEWEKLEKEDVQIISLLEEKYPPLLREIPNPPYLLYARGNCDILDSSPMVSIVGSRKSTPYGQQVALSLSKSLSQSGVIIISGMAIGIDSFAHKGALENGGKTIAILGNSLDKKSIYPKINLNLSEKISQNGTLISEYPIGTSAGPLTFPARNRLIAGLSFGTIVVEAGEKSGALLTAQMALDFNREVFSVPGSIFSEQSLGTNLLLKQGALPITSVRDILEELEISDPKNQKIISPKNPANEKEKIILEKLSSLPVHIDTLAKLTKLSTAELSSTLSVLEIKGWTKNIGGQNYIIT